MFRNKLKISLEMIDYDTLLIRLTNEYGHFGYTVNVDSMDIAEKHDAIRIELANNGWILTEKLERAITKGLYLMVVEEFMG